jgi:hypothetical protein
MVLKESLILGPRLFSLLANKFQRRRPTGGVAAFARSDWRGNPENPSFSL